MQHPQDDSLYYRVRLEHELALAETARHPEAARAHKIMAETYRDRLRSPAESRQGGERRSGHLSGH